MDWAARLGAPKRYEAKLTSAGGHLVVDVDATVRLPEVELPVVRVSPYLFTDEDVHRYARALLGEELKCLDPWNENNRTKAMWEKEIMALKNDLDHWEEYGSIIWDSYDSKADFERALQEKMARAANAPERPETAAPTWTWETPNVWTKDGPFSPSTGPRNGAAAASGICGTRTAAFTSTSSAASGPTSCP